ncbi:probable osmotically inducible sensory protein [Oceanicola granulosus HTCC2516]|uniref:Probable osmotically inducible sensory protein n=1 Tax=Oceanicola granulosus (strain ATCC BAA-861 / DSM 15982 / KCTC 12143 / HTCC2516) TaxID=314256 RepID=Q2CDX5_OCEGH|nr:BON domain-containing protein [Oceanicola granulosus]EAR50853.1 probable osmotically inducible sensory protein [Oceanicola granulosus HTCC2516]
MARSKHDFRPDPDDTRGRRGFDPYRQSAQRGQDPYGDADSDYDERQRRGFDPYSAGMFPWAAGWPAPMMPWMGAPYGRGGPGRDRHPHERDFFDKAGDEIASWFGDDDAERRREQDHRGRGPKGYVRSDARISEDVNDALTHDRLVDASEITVTVKDREVTLDGEVDSRQAKRRAEDCAEDCVGVEHVQNNLRVRRQASTF